MNPYLIAQLTQRTQVIHQLLLEHQELTIPKLSRLTMYSETSVRSALNRLRESRQVHEVRIKNRLVYRVGAPHESPPSRVAPWVADTTPYRGVDWSRSTTRRGCQDFLQLPTRVNDERRAYRTPVYAFTPTTTRER